MEFSSGRMRTIISSTLGAFIGLFAASPAALALSSIPQPSGVPSSKAAQSTKPSQSAKPSVPSSEASRGEVYYYFTMGHVDEMQFELTGQSDLATESIESYKKALELAPGSSVIMERLAGGLHKSRTIRATL